MEQERRPSLRQTTHLQPCREVGPRDTIGDSAQIQQIAEVEGHPDDRNGGHWQLEDSIIAHLPRVGPVGLQAVAEGAEQRGALFTLRIAQVCAPEVVAPRQRANERGERRRVDVVESALRIPLAYRTYVR